MILDLLLCISTIALIDAGHGAFVDAVVGDGVAEPILGEGGEAVDDLWQELGRQGDQHFIILHTAELAFRITRDGHGGLAGLQRIAP